MKNGARIYPIKESIDEMPISERLVYEYLESLSDSFTIFHSVQWIKRGNKWKSTWKENDFLILNKKLGALVLEVKGGDIHYSGGVFHQINTLTGEEQELSDKKRNDPLSQAIDGIYHYRKLLDSMKKGLSDRFPVEAAVWFTNPVIHEVIPNFPLKYREASGAILGNEDFKKGPAAIYNVYDFYNNYGKVNITDDEYDEIIKSIGSDFDLVSAPEYYKGQLDNAFLKLTNEQTGLLDYISEQRSATIQGVAGTGKTIVAKEAARRFGAEGRQVLYLCFNRFLYLYLMHRYPYENVTYLNIHTFIQVYNPGNSSDLSKPNDRAIALEEIDRDSLPFEDVVIDEGQDLVNDEIMYFKELTELKEGHFLVFYDKNQLLTTNEVPECIEKSECKLLLTRNCRNTFEIALTSYNVIDTELNQKTQMIHGKKTTISFAKGDPKQKLAKLIREFTNEQNGYNLGEIVILSLKPERYSILSGITNIDGIPISREKYNNTVFFTTASKFKGLESRVVVIIDIDESAFNREDKKRDFYVACSRATQRLSLFINGDEKKIRNIADCINKKRFAAQGKIAMKTQSEILEL